MPYRVGQVCERVGITPRQLREWERRGIVTAARGPGEQRTFSEADLATVANAKRMRDAGLSLAQVKLALAVVRGERLGVDVEGLEQVLAILARIRGELAVAEELTAAVRARRARARSGS